MLAQLVEQRTFKKVNTFSHTFTASSLRSHPNPYVRSIGLQLTLRVRFLRELHTNPLLPHDGSRCRRDIAETPT